MLLKKIYNKYTGLNPLTKLLLNIAGLALLWMAFYAGIRDLAIIENAYLSGTIHLTNFLLHAAEIGLNLMGYNATVYAEAKILHIPGAKGVMLDLGCLGRNTMGLFAGFIIAFPGSIKSKLWYIPAGILTIILINICRIIILSLSLLYTPEGYFRYNHHDLFKYAVFSFIFIMWIYWIKHFSILSLKKNKKKTIVL